MAKDIHNNIEELHTVPEEEVFPIPEINPSGKMFYIYSDISDQS